MEEIDYGNVYKVGLKSAYQYHATFWQDYRYLYDNVDTVVMLIFANQDVVWILKDKELWMEKILS